MKIIIDIPKEFEIDYKGDLFKDFFSRVLCDIEKGKCLCGNYEIETAEMFLKAFDESKPMDNIVAELEKAKEEYYDLETENIQPYKYYHIRQGVEMAIDIVKRGVDR